MNNTIKTQLEHKTIREFTTQVLDKSTLEVLYKVAMQTATSSGMQASSIIRVTDADIKRQLSEICNQEYVARLPEFWLFIMDNFRNNKIAKEINSTGEGAASVRSFFQSYIDASLMAKNVEVAAESMGLGTVFFGSIYNDIDRLIDLFNLPKLTFPVVGLGLGYPNQKPQLKPRMQKEMRIFENSYKEFDNYLAEIKDYDIEMTSYYDLRDTNKRSDSFSRLVSKNLTSLKSIDIIKKIENQGFKIR